MLFVAEMAVRLLFQENMSGRFEYGFHPSAGFIEEDGRLHLKRTGGRRFRPQSMNLKPPADTFRVFVIGDSVVHGSSAESSYAGRIAKELEQYSIKAESYNLGIGGHGARRKHLTLVQSLNYDPDLIILHINSSNEYEDEREHRRSQEFKSWHPRNWPMKSLALQRVYELKTERIFWRWIPQSIRTENAENDADAETQAALSVATKKKWDALVRETTLRSIGAVRAKAIPMLIISQAYIKKQGDREWSLDDDGLESLAESRTGSGVHHLSMKQILEELDFGKLFADGTHLHAEGHEVMAKAIARKIATDIALSNK